MRRSFHLIAALLTLTGSLAYCGDEPPTDTPAQPQQSIRLRLEDACSLRLVDGQLVIASQLRGMRLVDCPAAIAGLAGETTITLRPNYFLIENTRADGSLIISSMRDSLSIRIHGPNLNVDYRQNSESPSGFGYREARLNVTDGDWSSKANISGEDFASLRREHPAEVMQYLGPVFREIQVVGFFPDARVARQALAARGRGNASRGLGQLIHDLDADSFKERERALRELGALGPDAVALLENWDRGTLSPQQQTEIDAFLHAHLSSKEIEQKRKDAGYVLDCLYCADQAVRVMALLVLKGELKLDLTFDPQGDPFAQAPAIEALRAKVVAPTTQPAADH